MKYGLVMNTAIYICAQAGWGEGGLTPSASCASLRFDNRLRGPRTFATAPGAPVSQASGLLLVLLDQDYPIQHPLPHARMHLQYKRARFGLVLIAADQSPNKHFLLALKLYSLSRLFIISDNHYSRTIFYVLLFPNISIACKVLYQTIYSSKYFGQVGDYLALSSSFASFYQ